MADLEAYVDYQKRAYCNDLPCPIQVLLNQETTGSERFEFIRGICKTNCLHTTHEFHAWLINHGYLVVKPV